MLARDGEVILTSEMYNSKAAAKKGITSVQANCSDTDRYDRRTGKGSKTHFVLKAANHRVVGSSQTYNSKAALEKGIKSVMKNGQTKRVANLSS